MMIKRLWLVLLLLGVLIGCKEEKIPDIEFASFTTEQIANFTIDLLQEEDLIIDEEGFGKIEFNTFPAYIENGTIHIPYGKCEDIGLFHHFENIHWKGKEKEELIFYMVDDNEEETEYCMNCGLVRKWKVTHTEEWQYLNETQRDNMK